MTMHKQYGFTVIELMVSVVVLAILMSMAVPAYRSFIWDNQRAAAMNDLMASLQYARGEAVARSTQVGLCHTNTPTAANACGGGTGWENGWIVFLYLGDANNNNLVDAAEIGTVLRVHTALAGTVTLRGSANAVNRVVFQPTGTTVLEPSDGNLTYCDSRGFGDKARRILISAAGNMRMEKAVGVGSCT